MPDRERGQWTERLAALPDDDEEFRKRFEMAKARCLAGHEAGCSYAGLTPGGGHWFLVAARCVFSHGEACEVCGKAGDAIFCGWRDGTSPLDRGTVAGLIWGVTLCASCAARLNLPAPGGSAVELTGGPA